MKLTFETMDLRTKHAFNIARESGPAVRQTVWVRIEDDGVEGWGEAPATPFYGETAATVEAILPRLSEAMVRAAVPFPRETPRVLSAAFLVDRAASQAFRDRVDQLSALNTALDLDLTGPWPPYDFVSMVPPPPPDAQPATPGPVGPPENDGH